MHDVIPEDKIVLDDVPNDATRNAISPPAGSAPRRGQRARARKTDRHMMVALRSFAFMTQRKPTGCASANDEPSIKTQSAVEICCAQPAPAEGGAQTGHRAAVSYTGLVGNAHHSQASGEELFDEIIFFVVERGSAEMANRGGAVDRSCRLQMHETCACAIPKRDPPPCPSRDRAECPSIRARDISFSFRADRASAIDTRPRLWDKDCPD